MLFLYMALIDEKADQDTFACIYQTYRKQMALVALHILHNREDAEDALQATLLKLAEHIQSVPKDDPKKLRAYVLTAAKHTALTMLKQRKETADVTELNLAAEGDLFEQVQTSLAYETLLRAFRRLPSPYREVLMLVYVHDQSVQAAADVLHRKAGTVRQQLSRGRQLAVALCREEGLSFEDREISV